jgi:carbon monoxide dehydrogenase subunit G
MHFEGTVTINAEQEKVYAYLTDPQFVSQCAPGLESVEVVEPGKKFKVIASLGLGSVRSKFSVDVTFDELNPSEYARVKARGNTPGSAVEVTSDMHLTANPNHTTDLKWTADVMVVGTIASLAARLMGGVTQKMSSDFFLCVKSKIETPTEVKA